jgi:hypothetical protein
MVVRLLCRGVVFWNGWLGDLKSYEMAPVVIHLGL